MELNTYNLTRETPIAEFLDCLKGMGIHQLQCVLTFAEKRGLTTLGQFADAPREELRLVKGFGPKSFCKIERAIEKLGIASHLLITDVTKIPIKSLDMSTRLKSLLLIAKIQTLGDLANMKWGDVCRIHGIGVLYIREAGKLLESNGLAFRPD